MNLFVRTFTGSAAVALLVASVPLAATASPHPVYHRFQNQQQRIRQGVKSGQMTQAEYMRVHSNLQRINQQRINDLRKNDGHLTAAERHQINTELNRNSRGIFYANHNLATQRGVEEHGRIALPKLPDNRNSKAYIQSRITRQTDRIRNGLSSGQITRAEYSRDIGRLQQINAQQEQWLRQQHGVLTQAQKTQLNNELNSELSRIYYTKHNASDQHGV